LASCPGEARHGRILRWRLVKIDVFALLVAGSLLASKYISGGAKLSLL
jgi:hypothetical protein